MFGPCASEVGLGFGLFLLLEVIIIIILYIVIRIGRHYVSLRVNHRVYSPSEEVYPLVSVPLNP